MIEFRHGRLHGRAIVLDIPVNGVIGIVECARANCRWRKVLMIEGSPESDEIGDSIDRFLKEHPCGKEPFS